jgi:pimeloyl-ACP methyl ester carboxylesterase/DNA-binding CsgD family transcriptional regulator
MQQTIRFTRSRDGTRLAFAEAGVGPPLVKTGNWLSHLEYDWKSPVLRHFFEFLASRYRLLRYDARGCGLSDWEVEDLSLDAQVADMEAVVEAAQVERFPLLGISQGGVVAIEYAWRHPERVSHLILYGTFARGWFRQGPEAAQQARSLFDLIETGWTQHNPAFRQVFTSLFIPGASEEQQNWFGDLMRITSKPRIAARVLQSFGDMDVRDRLADIRIPTLVVHARHDAAIGFTLGRELAAGIPDAVFVELTSQNHLPLEHEPAWARFREVMVEFLGGAPPVATDEVAITATAGAAARNDAAVLASLTDRERQLLGLVARGGSNAEIARQLFISEKTVRNHLTSIFDKLGVDSRAKAIVVARDHGMGGL